MRRSITLVIITGLLLAWSPFSTADPDPDPQSCYIVDITPVLFGVQGNIPPLPRADEVIGFATGIPWGFSLRQDTEDGVLHVWMGLQYGAVHSIDPMDSGGEGDAANDPRYTSILHLVGCHPDYLNCLDPPRDAAACMVSQTVTVVTQMAQWTIERV